MMTEGPHFLGVARSLTGRRWRGPSAEADRLAEALVQANGLALPLARVLAARGVAPEGAEAFLAPTLRDLLPDPRSLKDMEAAAARLLHAVRARERIAIFADYDVDGGASAALLLDWLQAMGRDATLYVPDRIEEGYGPNAPAMAALARDHDLIVCVDCGTLGHLPIAAADGADVLILDHHTGDETLPPALAVVNPNRLDEDGNLAHLCAAAVVFLLLVEVNRQLRARGAATPDLLPLLDLVALATVADVAPLVGVNRAFVRQGLRVMAGRTRPGIAALADVARLAGPPTAYHLGFVLGPRINAGGRIGRADLGARLLATRDPQEAARLAAELDELNAGRRALEAEVRGAALAQVERRGEVGALAWAAGDGWHPGVVGIVAARLKEATGRPAVVIGFDGDVGKGSGRSVAGVDLGAAVHRLAAEGLIGKGGGHPMAAGLTLPRGQLEPAMARLGDILARQGAGAGGVADLVLDGVMLPGAASLDLISRIEDAGPFGQGARAPRFAFPAMAIRHTRRMGEGHLRLTFSDGAGPTLDAVAWRAMEPPAGGAETPPPLGQVLEAHRGGRFHLAGTLEINTWNGRQTAQLRLEDAAPVGG